MKTHILKLSFGLFLFLLLFASCQQDKLDNYLILKGEVVAINDPTIYKSLKHFKSYEFKNFDEFEFEESMKLEIRLGDDYSWFLTIIENTGLTENSSSYVTTDEGTFKTDQNGKHYQGVLNGNDKSSVRLSFYDHKMVGYIYDGNETYQIIKLNSVSDLDNYPNVIVVCRESDIITNNMNL
jgi:hypothetical protein